MRLSAATRARTLRILGRLREAALTLMLDTHDAVKRLTSAGVAEAIVTTFGEAVTAQAATKIDFADLRADLARLETRFTNKLYAGIATLLVLSKALDFLIGP